MAENYDLEQNFETQISVKCKKCHELHDVNSESYITLYGNLCVGKRGGVLGNGNWSAYGIPVTIMCRQCFVDFIRKETV